MTVNLPDDMRAGDTISGTVIAEPKGNTAEERAKNTAELTAYVVELNSPKSRDEGDKRPPLNVIVLLDTAKSNSFKITLPDKKTEQTPLNVNLRQFAADESSKFGSSNFFPLRENETAPGKIILTLTIPLTWPDRDGDYNPTFNIPPLGQTGRPIVITGPFDGNSSNTQFVFGPTVPVTGDWNGFFAPILAESPRKTVLSSPSNVTGPIQITVKEGDKQATGTFRNVGVNLSAPKTSLLKGEKTELKVEVSGLQGIKEPVPLTLESKGVITMEGGMYQPLVIQPSQVSVDGRYSTTRGITGVQAGGWNATATVVTRQYDYCLQDDSNPRTVILLNSLTGNYALTLPSGKRIIGQGSVLRMGCDFRVTDDKPFEGDRRLTLREMPAGAKLQGKIALDPPPRIDWELVMYSVGSGQCGRTASAKLDFVEMDSRARRSITITDRNTTDNTCAIP
jgi:hypothetical protein